MKTQINHTAANSIILTTGMFDLLKEHIRKKKLTKFNEEKIIRELKGATQVLRSQLPPDVVDVNTRVSLLDLTDNTEVAYDFVSHEKARKKNGTESILSPIGVAIVGYREGDEVSWQTEGRIKKYLIKGVSRI